MIRDPFSTDSPLIHPGEDRPEAPGPFVANLMAILSLALGIFSLLRLGLFSGPLAILLGYLSRNDCTRKGIATAGIVCGSITVALVLLLLFLFRNAGPPSHP